MLLRAGRQFGLGLEVGSKPELLAVLALLDNPDALLICNGYKDRVFLETALLATRLGHGKQFGDSGMSVSTRPARHSGNSRSGNNGQRRRKRR